MFYLINYLAYYIDIMIVNDLIRNHFEWEEVNEYEPFGATSNDVVLIWLMWKSTGGGNQKEVKFLLFDVYCLI